MADIAPVRFEPIMLGAVSSANVSILRWIGSLDRYFPPSWLMSLLRPIHIRGSADLA